MNRLLFPLTNTRQRFFHDPLVTLTGYDLLTFMSIVEYVAIMTDDTDADALVHAEGFHSSVVNERKWIAGIIYNRNRKTSLTELL